MADPTKDHYPEILSRYLPVQVAIRWCGLLEHEGRILAEMEPLPKIDPTLAKYTQTVVVREKPSILPRRAPSLNGILPRHYPEWSDLRTKTEFIVDAIRMGELPAYRGTSTARLQGPIDSSGRPSTTGMGIGKSDTVRHVDLKPWFTKFHPNDKPAFLFSETERAADTAKPKEYLALETERDALAAKLSVCEASNRELREAYEALTREASEPDTRSRKTYLNAIAALLACIEGDGKTIQKHPAFHNQTKLTEIIADLYDGYYGLSENNLHRLFAEAKRSLQGS